MRFKIMIKRIGLRILVGFCVFHAAAAGAGEVMQAPPTAPDPTAYYLFHMHGSWLEDHSVNEPNRRYGVYKYDDTLNALADKGLVVISEKRQGRVKPRDYVAKLSSQVNALIGAGVPASHITVSGFSKGGAMTLQAGAALQNSDVKFVVLSGCGIGNFAKGYRQFLKRGAARMQGRFLSIYDFRDTDGGPCGEAFSKAGLSHTKEIVLKVGSGHGVFYQPLPEWIDPLVAWAKSP